MQVKAFKQSFQGLWSWGFIIRIGLTVRQVFNIQKKKISWYCDVAVWMSPYSHFHGFSWGGWAPPSGLRSRFPGSCGSCWCHRWPSSGRRCRPPQTGGWPAQTHIWTAQGRAVRISLAQLLTFIEIGSTLYLLIRTYWLMSAEWTYKSPTIFFLWYLSFKLKYTLSGDNSLYASCVCYDIYFMTQLKCLP